MTSDKDIERLLLGLRRNYPSARLETNWLISYKKGLKAIPIEVLSLAAKHYRDTKSPHFPSTGQLIETSLKVMANRDGIPTKTEAWKMVRIAIRKYGYSRRPTFSTDEKSLSLIWETINECGGWRDICFHNRPDILRNIFLKTYEEVVINDYREKVLGD